MLGDTLSSAPQLLVNDVEVVQFNIERIPSRYEDDDFSVHFSR